ncbi:hypothetical protein D9758_015353 [Tetrapyrgos nigripes]|uniref:Uncharacterized protein n=1 Tax=Tetrapyrgos nigripes TaxID=182062 RepID=A0A8H5CL79_9AGAR|nr:hypothetical protein D9758_015353 [Tetrapyrgos nigripes]
MPHRLVAKVFDTSTSAPITISTFIRDKMSRYGLDCGEPDGGETEDIMSAVVFVFVFSGLSFANENNLTACIE